MSKTNDQQQLAMATSIKRVHTHKKSLKRQLKSNDTKCIDKPTNTCSNCGSSKLHDITEHEFPGKKCLIFECLSCGNNSIQSNVSVTERKQRLAAIAETHLDIIECRFCCRRFSTRTDYLLHLRNEHRSKKSN